MKRLASTLTILTALAVPGFSQDSIAPTTFSATLAVGGSTSVNKVVTVGQIQKPIDILFLVDATGSMGPAIANVSSGFNSIQNTISGFAPNVQFAVANYLDKFQCGSDPYAYTLNQNLTSNMSLIQNALNAVAAIPSNGYGCDTPESNLYGLQQGATTTSWRAGSARIIVWVGDAPGHDPAGTTTEAQAIQALLGAGVKVYAASASSGPGLDAACASAPCGTPANNQAQRITAATGGQDLGMFATNAIAAAIEAAITNAIGTYSTVSLAVAPVPAGVTVTITPASITGSFNRTTTRTFPFTVTFTGTVPGLYPFAINALVDGAIVATETDNIAVAAPLQVSKAFNPAKIIPGGTSTLTLSIKNPNAIAAAGVGLVDNYPAGVTTASPTGLASTCGGVTTTAAGSVTLVGGTLAANATCTISVNVTSTEGVKVNTTNAVTSAFGPGNTATATLSVASPATLTKTFGSVSILPGGSTSLTFVVANPNSTVSLTGLAFTDTLPAGLTVSSPNGLAGTCVGGITAPPGSNLITVNAVSLAAGSSCTIILNVTGDLSIVGQLVNTTSTITSTQAPPGDPATATLFLGDPYQISYFPNLGVGDSVIDISNAGSSGGVTLQSGTSAAVGGAICANVYSFTPDEQVVSCCSCPVTPNGLASFSLKNDIVANRLTGAIPTSTVVKLLATAPVGGTCVNSAAAPAPLAAGMVAWGTKLHTASATGGGTQGGGGATYAVTEVPFTSSSLSASELSRLRQLCSFILAQGSGSGVCASCRTNGLGAAAQ